MCGVCGCSDMTYDVHAVWDVHEQVCVAAMDCGDMATAEVS